MKVFLILNRRSRYPAPREFLVEELAEETRSPWWYIDGCVESRIGPRSQLLVYAKTNSRDVNKVRFSAVQTGILAEALVQGFDRYFISMRSPIALPGWVAFDGAALRAARRSGKRDIEAYRGVIEGDLLFYAPRRRMSRLGGKVDTLRMAMSNAWRIVMRDLRGRLGVPDVLCRTAKVHRNGWGGVLQGSVVLGSMGSNARVLVPRVRRRILRVVRRAAVPEPGNRGVAKRLPLAYARVSVFARDYRRRRILNHGLGPDLICTVQFQRMGRIQAPDIFGSTIEEDGKWRIAWNRSWLDKVANE
ncbi:hypothetical protein [Candidatus Palauibacter sp.]|uniref:hypothetical protein n=1 Tax=Candidatus Palauibacter sp. TaxID=3101350 RepID=UPI003C6F86E2